MSLLTCFLFHPSCCGMNVCPLPSQIWMQKEGTGILRNTSNQSTVCNSPVFVNYLHWKLWNEKKVGGKRQISIPFPFRPSIVINKSALESIGRMCVYQGVKNTWVCFCSVSIALVRMINIWMCRLPNMNCAILLILHVS